MDENTIIDLAKRGIIPLEAASAWVGYTKQVKNRFSSKAQRNPNAAELGIARLAHLLGKDLLSISQMDLLNHYDIVLRYLPDHARSLSADLSGAFRFYHERWQKNLLNQQLAKEGRPHREYLTDEEFRGKYGDEPWVVLDRLIQETRGLRYHFSRPERDFDELFRAELINDETGARVPISDLSSGEQVLLKIAVSM